MLLLMESLLVTTQDTNNQWANKIGDMKISKCVQ